MVPFSKHELDWLREQEAIRHEEHFYRLAGQNPNDRQPTDPEKWARAVSAFAPGTHQLPLDMSGPELDDLYNRFTQTFQGKRFYMKIKSLGKRPPEHIMKQFDAPRPYRSRHAIQTQKTRFPTLCRHFMRHLNDPHGGDRDADDMKSEPDSDFERDRNFLGPLPMPITGPVGGDGSDKLGDQKGDQDRSQGRDHDEDRLEIQDEDHDNPMFFTEADDEADAADGVDSRDADNPMFFTEVDDLAIVAGEAEGVELLELSAAQVPPVRKDRSVKDPVSISTCPCNEVPSRLNSTPPASPPASPTELIS